jgi:hypothetical protein
MEEAGEQDELSAIHPIDRLLTRGNRTAEPWLRPAVLRGQLQLALGPFRRQRRQQTASVASNAQHGA